MDESLIIRQVASNFLKSVDPQTGEIDQKKFPLAFFFQRAYSIWRADNLGYPLKALEEGGYYGGPLGAVFGAAMGRKGAQVIGTAGLPWGLIVGAIIGVATGFFWNMSNQNSLSDSAKRQLPGFMCLLPKDKWDGYGYIIEGFNIKCCGKVPYTITFYSPQGHLYADDDGDLKEGEKEYESPYNKPSYAVWRGQYISQALYSNDTRLWNNTKNLAKPHHKGWLPFKYPRACFPVPPVDLKDPTKWDEIVDRLKTIYVPIDGHSSRYSGDIFNKGTVKWGNRDVETENRLDEYWNVVKAPKEG